MCGGRVGGVTSLWVIEKAMNMNKIMQGKYMEWKEKEGQNSVE